jgi:hypothetical protein
LLYIYYTLHPAAAKYTKDYLILLAAALTHGKLEEQRKGHFVKSLYNIKSTVAAENSSGASQGVTREFLQQL